MQSLLQRLKLSLPGLVTYLGTTFLFFLYIAWRIFKKEPAENIQEAWPYLLCGGYLLASLALLFKNFWWHLIKTDDHLKWICIILVLFAAGYFYNVRHDYLLIPVLNPDNTYDEIRVWQDGSYVEHSRKSLPPIEDEGRNVTLASLLAKHGVSNYIKINDPKSLTYAIYAAHPPLYYSTLAVFSLALNKLGMDPYVAMRLLSFCLLLLNCYLVFLIYTNFFDRRDAKIISLLFLCIPYFFYYFGCRAQNEHFITTFTLLFYLSNIKLLRQPSNMKLLACGALFLAIAFWSKYTALLGLTAVALTHFLYNPQNISISRRLVFLSVQAAVGFIALAYWLLLIKGTSVGELQYARWIDRALNRVIDPGQIGKATSEGRGGIKHMAAYFPFDLGFPQFFLLLFGLWTLVKKSAARLVALPGIAWLGVYFSATFLVIPKLNYTLPAAHAMALLIFLGARETKFGESFKAVMLGQCLLTFVTKTTLWACLT